MKLLLQRLLGSLKPLGDSLRRIAISLSSSSRKRGSKLVRVGFSPWRASLPAVLIRARTTTPVSRRLGRAYPRAVPHGKKKRAAIWRHPIDISWSLQGRALDVVGKRVRWLRRNKLAKPWLNYPLPRKRRPCHPHVHAIRNQIGLDRPLRIAREFVFHFIEIHKRAQLCAKTDAIPIARSTQNYEDERLLAPAAKRTPF